MSANPMTAEHEKAGVLAEIPEDVRRIAEAAATECMPERTIAWYAVVHEVSNAIMADRSSRSTPSVPAVADLSKDELTRGTARRAEGGRRPHVKALEWVRKPLISDTLYADSVLGAWAIWEIGGRGYVREPGKQGGKPVQGGMVGASSAAQADYEARILAALDLPDPDAVPKAVDAAARPTGHFAIDHDGFAGTVIGHYTTREGKQGVVLQQDGTRVVHVYGEKWLKPTAARSIEPGKDEERLREALTPSAATKAAYIGEFFETTEVLNAAYDPDDEDSEQPETVIRKVPVSWTTIKAIMAAIRARALSPSRGEADTSQDRAAAQTDAGVERHHYSPDLQAGGDCRECGHQPDSRRHLPPYGPKEPSHG